MLLTSGCQGSVHVLAGTLLLLVGEHLPFFDRLVTDSSDTESKEVKLSSLGKGVDVGLLGGVTDGDTLLGGVTQGGVTHGDVLFGGVSVGDVTDDEATQSGVRHGDALFSGVSFGDVTFGDAWFDGLSQGGNTHGDGPLGGVPNGGVLF